MARVIALIAVLVIWVSFGARGLHLGWAPSPVITLAVAAGLFALSRSFNENVHFRSPRDCEEQRFVERLRILGRVGVIGIVVSMVWLAATSTDNFIIGFIVPLCIFVVSAALEGTSAALYRPYVVRDAGT